MKKASALLATLFLLSLMAMFCVADTTPVSSIRHENSTFHYMGTVGMFPTETSPDEDRVIVSLAKATWAAINEPDTQLITATRVAPLVATTALQSPLGISIPFTQKAFLARNWYYPVSRASSLLGEEALMETARTWKILEILDDSTYGRTTVMSGDDMTLLGKHFANDLGYNLDDLVQFSDELGGVSRQLDDTVMALNGSQGLSASSVSRGYGNTARSIKVTRTGGLSFGSAFESSAQGLRLRLTPDEIVAVQKIAAGQALDTAESALVTGIRGRITTSGFNTLQLDDVVRVVDGAADSYSAGRAGMVAQGAYKSGIATKRAEDVLVRLQAFADDPIRANQEYAIRAIEKLGYRRGTVQVGSPRGTLTVNISGDQLAVHAGESVDDFVTRVLPEVPEAFAKATPKLPKSVPMSGAGRFIKIKNFGRTMGRGGKNVVFALGRAGKWTLGKAFRALVFLGSWPVQAALAAERVAVLFAIKIGGDYYPSTLAFDSEHYEINEKLGENLSKMQRGMEDFYEKFSKEEGDNVAIDVASKVAVVTNYIDLSGLVSDVVLFVDEELWSKRAVYSCNWMIYSEKNDETQKTAVGNYMGWYAGKVTMDISSTEGGRSVSNAGGMAHARDWFGFSCYRDNKQTWYVDKLPPGDYVIALRLKFVEDMQDMASKLGGLAQDNKACPQFFLDSDNPVDCFKKHGLVKMVKITSKGTRQGNARLPFEPIKRQILKEVEKNHYKETCPRLKEIISDWSSFDDSIPKSIQIIDAKPEVLAGDVIENNGNHLLLKDVWSATPYTIIITFNECDAKARVEFSFEYDEIEENP